jgi:hypothetical protein
VNLVAAPFRITLDLLPGAEDEAAGLLDTFLALQLGAAEIDRTAAPAAQTPL